MKKTIRKATTHKRTAKNRAVALKQQFDRQLDEDRRLKEGDRGWRLMQRQLAAIASKVGCSNPRNVAGKTIPELFERIWRRATASERMNIWAAAIANEMVKHPATRKWLEEGAPR